MKQYFKKNGLVEIYSEDNQKQILRKKIFLKNKHDQINIFSEIEFFKKYNHHNFANLIEWKFEKDYAILSYEYENGIPIDTFINLYPQYESDLWEKIIHFVRYLKYHLIYISNLKPEHVLVTLKQNNLDFKIIDISGPSYSIESQWQAPEQNDGRISWISNLYTFALFFVSKYSNSFWVKQQIHKGLSLELPKSCPIHDTYEKFLAENEFNRLYELDQYCYSALSKQFIPNAHVHACKNFLHFYKIICDCFYCDNFSITSVFQVYYNLVYRSLNSFWECENPEIKIKTDDFYLTKNSDEFLLNYIHHPMDNCDYYGVIQESFMQNADFVSKEEDIPNEFNKNEFNTSYDYVIKKATLIKNTGAVKEAHKYLKDNFNKFGTNNDIPCELLYQWLCLVYFDDKLFTFVLNLITNGRITEISTRINSKVGLLTKVKSYQKSNSKDKIIDIVKETDNHPEILIIILEILVFNHGKHEFYQELFSKKFNEMDLDRIAELLILKMESSDINQKQINQFILILYLMKSYRKINKMFIRLCKITKAKNNNQMEQQIIKVLENHIVSNIKSNELFPEVYKTILDYYESIENYDKIFFILDNFLRRDYKEDISGILYHYLLVSCKNHSFGFTRFQKKLLRYNMTLIRKKFRDGLSDIVYYLNTYSGKEHKNFFERLLQRKLYKTDYCGFLLDYENIINQKKYDMFSNLIEEKLPDSKYQCAELFYYAGISYIKRTKNNRAVECLKISQDFFNKIGLRFRSHEINREIKSLRVEKFGDINFNETISHFSRCKSTKELLLLLESKIYVWTGFEVVLPFLIDDQIGELIPIGILEDSKDGYEGHEYSSHIIKNYKQNIDEPYIFESTSSDIAACVNRLNIKNAICIPMIHSGSVFGTLYMHSKSSDIVFPYNHFNTLIPLISTIGLSLEKLYKTEMNQRYIKHEMDSFYGIIGKSDIIKSMVRQIIRLSSLPYSVLITGEAGVGKELVAQAIFKEGNYSSKMVNVNCTNLSKELFESELFGHMKGSFSGAFDDKIGKVEAAENSILFFDEIGDLNLELQAKLLRLLENRTYYPVGSQIEKNTNARFLFATNQNLEKAVENNIFRTDLYSRIKQFQIHVPALHEHVEDIPLYVDHFTRIFISDNPNFEIKPVSKNQVNNWQNCKWKGNIRDLKYEIFRALAQEPNPNQRIKRDFHVELSEKLTTKQLNAKYTLWLKSMLGSINQVVDYLDISRPTYYRLIKGIENEDGE